MSNITRQQHRNSSQTHLWSTSSRRNCRKGRAIGRLHPGSGGQLPCGAEQRLLLLPDLAQLADDQDVHDDDGKQGDDADHNAPDRDPRRPPLLLRERGHLFCFVFVQVQSFIPKTKPQQSSNNPFPAGRPHLSCSSSP